MPNPWLILIVVAFFGVSVAGAAWKGYSLGVQHEQVKAAKERERIHDENLEALSASRRRIAELDAANAKLEDEARKADDEAAADPNAARVSLGVDSVRRLNRIGR